MSQVTNVQEANKRISENLAEINKLYAECKRVANEFKIEFYADVDGVYGTGAWFESGQWNASSHSC